jgi:hypothetical protein
MECCKTPNYDALIKCLEESENENAANILKEIIPDQNEILSQTESSRSRSESGATSASFTDFVVQDSHVKLISNIINEEMPAEGWEEVKSIWLTQKMRNDVGRQNSMKLDIMNSLRTWISGTASKQRLFSKIIEAFDDYPKLAEKLENSASLMLTT